MAHKKIKIWSEAELVDTFGLTKTIATHPLLIDWLDAKVELNQTEIDVLSRIRAEAIELIYSWNEEDLKMNFIAFVIDIAQLRTSKYVRTFYEKTVEATVEEYYLKTKTDFMIAKGVLDLAKTPYFHFQEYKKDQDPHGDPMAQLVEAFLIAQEKNKNGKPMYGCYVVGRFWYFVIMEAKNYCVSYAYDCTDETGLFHIIAVLRKFKVILETTLID
ncbi:MAG: hypothetical protein ACRCSB_01930 [Bacteroidales bacterium]